MAHGRIGLVSTGPELLLFGDKQPQGPNANRAVKPDGRGKDMLEIRKNQALHRTPPGP